MAKRHLRKERQFRHAHGKPRASSHSKVDRFNWKAFFKVLRTLIEFVCAIGPILEFLRLMIDWFSSLLHVF
jgi:hypothetical protein